MESLYNKIAFLGACNFTKEDFDTCANSLRTIILKNICERLLLNFIQKETPTQVFSCEFCELIKNTYFAEGLQTASSEIRVRRSLFNKVASLTG